MFLGLNWNQEVTKPLLLLLRNSETAYRFLLELPLHWMSLQPNSKPIFSLWPLIVVNCAVSALFCAIIYVVLIVNVVDYFTECTAPWLTNVVIDTLEIQLSWVELRFHLFCVSLTVLNKTNKKYKSTENVYKLVCYSCIQMSWYMDNTNLTTV